MAQRSRGDPAETEEHVGQVIQQNADLIARNARDEAALKADANGPRWLTPIRWMSVAGGVALSAAAGFSILWNSLPQGKVISAALAFTASILTGLHVALKGDAHQSECRRLIQAFLAHIWKPTAESISCE
jgi:hypothetical protein